MAMRFAFVALTALMALSVTGVQAAPQMLGVVASADPKPLFCENGTCTVEISAFCLQQEREMPAWGTVYRALEPGKIVLVARRVDGTVARRPVGDIARITTKRGHWAVTIAVPETAVQSLGANQAGISVGELVSLVPEPVAGDPNPLSPDEIAHAADALRISASPFVEGDEHEALAAALVNDLINALPTAGLDGTEFGDDLWQRTFGQTPGVDLARLGTQQAAQLYRMCRVTVAPGDGANMRRCLEFGHDGFISQVNRRYWMSIAPGA